MKRDDHLPFVALAHGRFTPAQVHVAYHPAPRETTAELDGLIASEWERQLAAARLADRILFNGKMLRYVAHYEAKIDDRDTILLTVGPTCYRDFVGTNLYHSHRLNEFGWNRFSNPVGTTATLITRDGLICYGRRSQRVAFHAGYVHTFGGALEEADRAADGSIDPFASLCRELREELGLQREELGNLHCVGLIRDRQIHQPELLFEATANLSADELGLRWQSAEARDEHAELVTLPDNPQAVAPFLRSCGPIAPVAVGAIMFHGRLSWGESWFEDQTKNFH